MYVYKISYIVYALQYLKGRFSNNSKIFLLYDVACILKRHLEVRMYVYQSCITYIEVEIKTHDSESRGQEEAAVRDE